MRTRTWEHRKSKLEPIAWGRELEILSEVSCPVWSANMIENSQIRCNDFKSQMKHNQSSLLIHDNILFTAVELFRRMEWKFRFIEKERGRERVKKHLILFIRSEIKTSLWISAVNHFTKFDSPSKIIHFITIKILYLWSTNSAN